MDFAFSLFILLTFVWFTRKIFQFFHLPPLVGEVFAGILAGPLILGLVKDSVSIEVLAQLGIFFLMFHAGLETAPSDFFRSSRIAFWVALGSIVLPFSGAYFLSYGYGYDVFTSFFIALNISVSAVAISARLLKDCKISKTCIAHVTLTADIFIEIVVLVFLSIFLEVRSSGGLDWSHIHILVLTFLGYFAIVFHIGNRYFRYLYRILYRGNKGFTFSLILALGFGVLAELIGLHMIIGAFMAGLFLRKELLDPEVYKKIEDRVFGLSYSFLGPIFFATLAFHLDMSAFRTIPGFVFLLFLVSIFGKIFGAGLMTHFQRMSFTESVGVGLVMNNRGALALIVSSIGLQAGIITQEIFSVLVLVSFGATLLSILLMKPYVVWFHGKR